MSRPARLLVILAAWAIPVAWVVAALVLRPSDGTVVWSPALAGGAPWGESVTVSESYGQSAFAVDDEIVAVEGRPVAEWLAGDVSGERSVGDRVTYQVTTVSPDGLGQTFERTVTLTHFPLTAAVVEDLPVVATAVLLMVGGAVAFFLRPGLLAAQALLGAMVLAPSGLFSTRWGVGAIDLAGGRGLWPHLVTEVACAIGLGLAVLAAVSWRSERGWLGPRRWVVPVVVLLPFVGYGAWAVVSAATTAGPELTQALLSVAVPSLAVAAPAVLLALAATYRLARTRAVRQSARLALLVLLAGAAARLVLGDLPEAVTGAPILPWDLLLLLLTPPVLAGVVVALVGYRLDDIEPLVRRTVGQGAVAAAVGTAFVLVAATVGQATDVSVSAILAGGAVALLVLPIAVVVQRGVRRLMYGDRDLPRTLVTELRRLDATTGPSEALSETLQFLTRRLRLAHAVIELPGGPRGAEVLATVGAPGGRAPLTVALESGGVAIGSLHLEVAADRDPFGRGDRVLLEDVGAQVGALVQAVLANRELSRSRQEIVAAREEERRRLRRDLHDGLGPSLATLAMRLESAEEMLDTDPGQAAEAVAGLADLARGEIAEVRRLVEGLRPAALDQLGLVSALRQRAAQHDVSAGDGVPVWTVVADDSVEPLPAAVEVAAYRIVLEAVTNAVRHSGARSCIVSLSRSEGDLLIRVEDDGHGLAEDRPAGVGLSSMRERAAEVGGTCTVSADGDGTVVAARLPLGSGDATADGDGDGD